MLSSGSLLTFFPSLQLRFHFLPKFTFTDEELSLRKEYGETKTSLVRNKHLTILPEDRMTYNYGKNKVLAKILKKAGWTDEELEVVANRGPILELP